jgi:hypothetical protein
MSVRPHGVRYFRRSGFAMAEAAKPILSALAAEERAGIRLATFTRLGALAIIGLWITTRAVGQARTYYLAIILIFALIGLGQLLLSRWQGRGARVAAYALTLLDMVVLTVALVVPNPIVPEGWSTAMQLRLGNFDFFYVLIGLAVLGFSPARALGRDCRGDGLERQRPLGAVAARQLHRAGPRDPAIRHACRARGRAVGR